jgi:flagellar biogenesis protein FliO
MPSLNRASPLALGAALWALADLVHAQAAASAVPIPFKPEADTNSPGLGQWVAVVLGCLVLLAVLLVVLRTQRLHLPRWRGAPSGTLSVLEQTSLNATTRLVAVRYQNRHLLLAVGPGFVSCLRDDTASEAPSHPPASPSEGQT